MDGVFTYFKAPTRSTGFSSTLAAGICRKEKITSALVQLFCGRNPVPNNIHFDSRTMDSDSSLDVVNSALYRYRKTNFLFKDPMRPKDLDALLDLELRPTDVFVVTYPKSGSVWMQQILVQIMDIVHPEQAEDLINRNRVPWVEDRLFDEPFRDRPDPRYFGSHLPVDMLPRDVKNKNLKVVYVWRNPRDVLVSLYHFSEAWVFLESPKSFEDFFQDFLNGDVYMGSWFDHVRGYQAERDRLQIHFMKFEDMLKDLRGEVEKLCLFLGHSLTEEQMDRVVETSTFNNMKVNPKANYKDLVEKERYSKNTMRKGVAGDWKNHFTVAQNERFDQVFKEKMRDVSLSCSWE